MPDRRFKALIQFISFGMVGVSNVIVSYIIYVAAIKFLEIIEVFGKYDYLVAQGVSFLLSVAWSFYWNNRFVFAKETSEERNLILALLKTYISYAFTGLFLNGILSLIWIEVVGISKYIAPLINLIVCVPLNFVMNKFWAFRTK